MKKKAIIWLALIISSKMLKVVQLKLKFLLTFKKISARHGGKVERMVMAGNSIRSDVLPMINAGGFGIYVPFDILWDHEHETVPSGTERFYEVENISGVVGVVQNLAQSSDASLKEKQ